MMRRLISASNVAALGVTLGVFYVSLLVWATNLGVVVASVVAAAAGALTWYILHRRLDAPDLGSALADIPYLGSIPNDSSGPAPALTADEISDRFTGILREIEGSTTGRVLLVSSPAPGQGASRVALNLSIAASRAGRRVMLIDADSSTTGIGQFLSSGRSPGLSDVATGAATLTQATRMWTLEDGARFPMLPSGEGTTDADALAGVLVADALDVVSEHADLIVIDVPPVMWSDVTPELGAHADGTLLVLTDAADPETVTAARFHLEAAGAPVAGYVRNRSDGATLVRHRARRAMIGGAIAAVVLLLGYATYTAVQLFNSWNQVETIPHDIDRVVAMQESDEPLEQANPEDEVILEDGEGDVANTPPTTAPTEAYETLLLIGSDEIAHASDVILYLVRPTNGADPFMVSLPRDLYVENPCTGGHSRINALIKGCTSKDINGPTLLSYEVGAITGIAVDHFALFDFEGFRTIIDAVGGVEICVEYPVRDAKAELDLPAGCTQASGDQALAWVRSRKTQQLVNGSWSSVPGASDLQRNQHQQDVLLQLFSKMKSFSSPKELTTKVASLADNFALDSGLSITEAVNLAWSLRSLDIEDIKRLEIPVRLARSTSGQSILKATATFDEVLADAYDGDLPSEDDATETAAPAP